MKKVIVLTVLVSSLTGCGLATHAGDHFVLSGTPEGVRAFGDTLNGSMRTAKEAPGEDSKYFAHRQYQEQQLTARATAPGFLQKLMGGGEK